MKASQLLSIVGSVIALVAWFYIFKFQGFILLGLIALIVGGLVSILRQKSWIFKIMGMIIFVVGLLLLVTYPWLLYCLLFLPASTPFPLAITVTYLVLSFRERNSLIFLEENRFDETATAVLEDITVLKYQRLYGLTQQMCTGCWRLPLSQVVFYVLALSTQKL